MMMTLSHKIMAGAIAGVLLLFAGTAYAWHKANARADRAAFQADSLAAANDSTKRVMNRKIQEAVGESTYVLQRRVVQASPANDALAMQLRAAFGAIQVMASAVTASIAERQGTATATTHADAGDSIRSASFNLRLTPYTLTADARLPRPPGRASLDATIRTDPAKIGARLTCGPQTNGVRRADIFLTTPTWLTATVDSIQQDPFICNSDKSPNAAAPWWKPKRSVGVLGGWDPLYRHMTIVAGGGLTWTF
jgi:hypothetical protein